MYRWVTLGFVGIIFPLNWSEWEMLEENLEAELKIKNVEGGTKKFGFNLLGSVVEFWADKWHWAIL